MTLARALVAACVLGGALACDPPVAISPPAPANSCPAHPCEAYAQAVSPACREGRCVVDPAHIVLESGAPPTGDLVVLVTPSQDAVFGAGLTFPFLYDALVASASGADGGPPASAALPALLQINASYEVSAQLAQTVVRWNLGNASFITTLPMHATFQATSIPLLPDGSVGLGGVPIDPVTVATQATGTVPPGPGMTPGLALSIQLPPGNYRETWVVDPPFRQAFGPVSQPLTLLAPHLFDQGDVEFYDTTTMASPPAPTVSFTRAHGSFDGWTAYVRDASGAVVSNVVPLSGASTGPVRFTMRRILSGPIMTSPGNDLDAFQDVLVVVAPPVGSTEPVGLFNPLGFALSTALPYLTLPPAVTVSGAIAALGGLTAPVDLTFEAVAINNGQGALDPTSFEFTTWATVQPDPVSGVASYSVVLPPGEYRVDARARSLAIASGVVDLLVPAQTGPWGAPPITLGSPQPTSGFVRVADGRPVAGASIVGIPQACPPVARSAPSTPACLPRSLQTTSGADGSFVLPLDPGTYRVRVEPPPGSRLPWVDVASPLVVPSADVGVLPLAPIVLPAPLAVGLRLVDPSANPVPNAWVRVFRLPGASQGAPIELGEATTDADGRYELYVAPPE